MLFLTIEVLDSHSKGIAVDVNQDQLRTSLCWTGGKMDECDYGTDISPVYFFAAVQETDII